MQRSRRDVIERIFSQRADIVPGNLLGRGEPETQVTYCNRLKSDIGAMNTLISQADLSIMDLEQELNRTKESNTIQLKREILALSKVNSRLAYMGDKGDTLGIATTSSVIGDLVMEQEELYQQLYTQNMELHVDITEKNVLISELQSLSQIIHKRISSQKQIYTELAKKNQEIEEDPMTETDILTNLNDKWNEALHYRTLMDKHTQEVLRKFMELTFPLPLNSSDEGFAVSSCSDIVHNLVTIHIGSLRTGKQLEWLELFPNETLQKFISCLLLSDIAIAREDSSAGHYFLKLRSFGTDF